MLRYIFIAMIIISSSHVYLRHCPWEEQQQHFGEMNSELSVLQMLIGGQYFTVICQEMPIF